MMKADKFQFKANTQKGDEEFRWVVLIFAAFFGIYAMDKLEPKTIVVNQTLPAQAAPKQPEDTEVALPKVSTEGEQIKLEVPFNASSSEKPHDRLADVPKITLLPTPLNASGKAEYQNLINQAKRASVKQDKSPVTIQAITEEKEDDDGGGVYVVLRSKNIESTEKGLNNNESEAADFIIGSKEKSESAKASTPEPKNKTESEIKKPEELKKAELAPVKLQQEAPVDGQATKDSSLKNTNQEVEAKNASKK